LDGLRALSIIAVLLYHGGIGWADGGFVGVEVFFVLSGFLITTLLVAEWSRSGQISLSSFWARRARRLLPALLCLIAVIGVYYASASADAQIPGLAGDGIAALFYFGNWHQLAVGSGYFVANGPISPLTHTWSLAVEEQFYLAWPLVVVGVFWLIRRRSRSQDAALVTLLFVTLLGVIASVIDTTMRLRGGAGIDRVYYGTDTRAAGLLAGAALAITLALREMGSRVLPATPGLPRRSAGIGMATALLCVVAAVHWVGGSSLWMYPYGLLGVDAAVLVVITGIVLLPGSIVVRVLSVRPLRALGVVSYGVYLWHFPLFLWLTTASIGLSGGPLFGARIAATLAVSAVSYLLVERPIRQRRLPAGLLYVLAPAATAGALAMILVASSVDASALASAATAPPEHPAGWLRGTQPQCPVELTDARQYGVVPLSPQQASRDEPAWLVGHKLRWSGSASVKFATCPPKRVLVIGDSLAFTLGVGWMEDEQAYGVEVADAAILGCAFNNQGQLNSRGNWENQYPGCPNALQEWAAEERGFGAQAVVVELGYRDEFDWRWNGQAVHIGQASFDSYVRARIEQYVHVLGRNHTPILFLTVPWSNPAALPDGSPAPASSPARHAWINSALKAAAAADPSQVRVLNIDALISPGNHYDGTLDGKLCRFDGVHFTVFCSRLLQPAVLTAVREMIASGATG
jgi:peptidoglycan/LPS O-acetylase OafA/YrhL